MGRLEQALENIRKRRRSSACSTNNKNDSSKDRKDPPARIRVGKDYQVELPEFVPVNEREPEPCDEEDLQIWSPINELPGETLDEYLASAKEIHRYDREQALGVLFYFDYNVEAAKYTLSKLVDPASDDWTAEDKASFEEAFQLYGKNFQKIRERLVHKSIASLVEYYYKWKKTRTRESILQDRQFRKFSSEDKDGKSRSKNGSESSYSSGAECEESMKPNKQQISILKSKSADSMDEIDTSENVKTITSHWTDEECLLAVTCIRDHGKNFSTIAKIIGTKTEAHLRSFFFSCRRKYQLDQLLSNFEADHLVAKNLSCQTV